jgi:tRNA(Ile)-lysidine synthase TilS/MesJ
MNKIQVCKKCVMDTTATEIVFDENGVCNFCNHFDTNLINEVFSNRDGVGKIDKLIKQIKERGKNRQYDCLIGISGGVDSSYVAYLVKKKYNLRVYAVHLDNGWNSELAVANVEQILKRLDIDLYTYVLNWKEFRDIQISFLKSGISNIEIPTDHAIWALLIKTAAKMRIPYIIAGNNVVTE